MRVPQMGFDGLLVATERRAPTCILMVPQRTRAFTRFRHPKGAMSSLGILGRRSGPGAGSATSQRRRSRVAHGASPRGLNWAAGRSTAADVRQRGQRGGDADRTARTYGSHSLSWHRMRRMYDKMKPRRCARDESPMIWAGVRRGRMLSEWCLLSTRLASSRCRAIGARERARIFRFRIAFRYRLTRPAEPSSTAR